MCLPSNITINEIQVNDKSATKVQLVVSYTGQLWFENLQRSGYRNIENKLQVLGNIVYKRNKS